MVSATNTSPKLNLRLVQSDEEDSAPFVLIEGDQATLEWFGKLILDHASGMEGCGRQMGPGGPGSHLFAKTSTLSFYLHRLPCEHSTLNSEAFSGRTKS
jgi:hypothetical protein